MKYAHNFKDWTGKEVGPFLVLNRIGITKSGNVIWKVKCKICNNISVRKIDHLTLKTKACQQCTDHLHGSNHASWKGIGKLSYSYFGGTKRQAKKRKIEFKIKIKYLWNLFLKQNAKCALSGLPISFSDTMTGKLRKETTASLDRINSSKGYIKGNVQWVHKNINIMKQRFSEKDFISFCHFVSNYNKGKL